MDSPKAGLDLEKELTCSICTDLLYQPLTLLDCLHTFCGSCLKEWFGFQAATIERNPIPPTPDAVLFTCPSCRAPVRDTRHNATVVTLLDMFITAQPEKGRSKEEKEEMGLKYKPGDQVLPKIATRQRTEDERRADEEEQRLVEEVRLISLQEATPDSARQRSTSTGGDGSSEFDARRRRAHEREGSSSSSSRRPPTAPRRSIDYLDPESGDRRSRRTRTDRDRQVEHQSSLRSLISSADMSERDIEREIEDFARQIQEEGLLEGLDLDNIDLARDDELSRRITEAYRRRQREKIHSDMTRRSNASGQSGSYRPSPEPTSDSRPGTAMSAQRGSSSRSSSQQRRVHSRSASASRPSEDRSRPPPSMSASLDIRDAGAPRTRRRTRSGGRSITAPPPSMLSAPDTRPAARSQTDLLLGDGEASSSRLGLVPGPAQGGRRSSSTPNVPVSNPPPAPAPQQPLELPAANLQSFANRMPREAPAEFRGTSPTSRQPATPPEPSGHHESSLAAAPTAAIAHSPVDLAVLFPEPSISCTRCRKTHIEYELHYNCYVCNDGQWNICLDCYRTGKGCQYWFGFGYAAWNKWERARQQHKGDKPLPKPHMLTACRYTPPPSTPGGANGRKTLTTDDPKKRLETGTFCARCLVWTNECYWRCNVCNDGDWGFCNNCVNQGKSCSHPLLPLTHEEELQQMQQRHPSSPNTRPHSMPSSASILTGPTSSNIGPFKPLTFNTSCDVCQDTIPPLEPRYHCYSCTSALIPDATPGDYDICYTCYGNLVEHDEISPENGHSGWRRCLSGHRMVIVGFTEGKIGQWRYIDSDLVGGRALRQEPYYGDDGDGDGKGGVQLYEKWSWEKEPGATKCERLVTRDVRGTAPATANSEEFPPDGGAGRTGFARWPWYPRPGVDNELLFPRGAEITDIKLISGEWYLGSYMADRGLFPAKYIQLEEESA
ncbi:E3 ubiquitin-protein ligase CHFR [Geosmithia morbida]|uniref:E3 ubiquitin-protein ligase CHFR n=1 Tax=Geosmithia morbida TaxID=1094350 RepID=A0A9P4YSJ1_9HYPO|nr:E3 ubiquitin-protein ligase CHFR [Geosmithia morbida]KAF4121270.1 E3 ubiquitin-protein ligase CHFR [Geosmithia morbida]